MPEPDITGLIQQHFEHATALHAQMRFPDAIAELQKVFKLAPDLPEAHFNMGNVLRDSGNIDLSVEAYIAAVKAAEIRGRRYPEALINLGDAFMKQKRTDFALIAFSEAIEAAPQAAEAWMGLGVARYDARDFAGAIQAYSTALEFAPTHKGVINNLAITNSRLGNMDVALRFYDRLVALEETPEGKTDRALTLLYMGRYAEGLPDYEARWGMGVLKHTRCNTGAPEWQGEPLKGRTIIAYGEQGYGDSFQFSRYLSTLTARGAYVIALVERPILKLIESVPGVAEALPTSMATQSLPRHDYSVALMSLPYRCGTLPETIPAKIPYIFADEALVRQWRETLEHLPGLKIGLVWAGRPEHPFDHDRSMALSALAPLGQIPGLSFVALQQGPRADEEGLEAFRPGKLADFSETAAIVENLDLVIGVDTSVTHLVGAMGKPIWLMLPLVSEWRWMLGDETCPWYPTMRIFRQTTRDDWSHPVERVVTELMAMVAKV